MAHCVAAAPRHHAPVAHGVDAVAPGPLVHRPAEDSTHSPLTEMRRNLKKALTLLQSCFIESGPFEQQKRLVAGPDGQPMDPGATKVLWVKVRQEWPTALTRMTQLRDVALFGAGAFCVHAYLDHYAL